MLIEMDLFVIYKMGVEMKKIHTKLNNNHYFLLDLSIICVSYHFCSTFACFNVINYIKYD